MKGFFANIEKISRANTTFRTVLYTGVHTQLVLMSLQPNQDIGMETHSENDQFFRFEQGEGKVLIDGHEYVVTDGDAVIVPAGAEHNVINTSDSLDLRMYTLYSPAHHQDGVVRQTKDEAEASSPDFDGTTSE